MPPKKATTAATKKAAGSGHASYRDMIKDAILNLKERNGSSRQSIKKYVQANNKLSSATPAAFDSQFNKAIKTGVEKGDFTQPKGPSGPVKLAKKEAAPKPAPKKTTTAAKPGPKKAAAKKTEKSEKAEKPKTTKKTATSGTTAKKPVGRPKANTAKPRKASTTAPAVVDQPKVIGTTKSGRVTKTTAKPAEKAKKAAPKKKAT
ncbi:hypothetical protein P170DRAFT_461848 [Aspergillus steynii IBT 23096]|uniref:Histone H1 n=1 Tax=Aspergillus steynii IBT 23096 TaxID=1392250 RepID=A0A2I2GFS8_9EURO|nr:uncharacterized protein P170DRAFT_461848 [Aspergillus steynii IBT 23096]PLB51687.1 hypothetical protein P170DRAFT_461848 [Aspergillus steynii IBT 23096]